MKISELRNIIRAVLNEVNFPGRPTGYSVEPFEVEDEERLANAGFPSVFELDEADDDILKDTADADSGG